MDKHEEMKSLLILTHFTEEMSGKVIDLAEIIDIPKGDYIFKEGDYAECFYSLIKGRIALEVEVPNRKPVRIKDIVEGHSFGISALVESEEKKCISHAKALEDCRVAYWKAADLEKLFYQDYELGFIFLKRISFMLKDRLQVRNAQIASLS